MESIRVLKHLAVVSLLAISMLLIPVAVITQISGVSFPASFYQSKVLILDGTGTPDLDRGGLAGRGYLASIPPQPTPLPTPVAPEPLGLSWPLSIRGTLTNLYANGHWAVDIGADCGTAVLAADAGVVKFAGWKTNGGGKVVDVQHDWGIVTSYNHLSAIVVVEDQVVARGEKVGEVGASGTAIGCHLHWGVAVNGRWVNPLDLLL